MNEQDKQAFESAWAKAVLELDGVNRDDFEDGWQAALEYARGQQEPVVFSDDSAWSLANKVRTDLDRKSCPGVFMDLAMESINRHYTPPAQQQEPVDLRELFERLLFGTYAGKDSYYNDEQIKHGCFERAQELVDVAKRMNIALYTAPPAAAINEQLLEALKPFAVFGRVGSRDVEVRAAVDAIAAAEAAKGGA